MSEKVLTEKTKELIVKAADDAVDLPFYLEPFDGLAFKIILNFLDRKAALYVPDTLDALINESITLAFAGNIDLASEKIGTALNAVIDIPVIEEDDEQLIFVDGLKFIIRLIKKWIDKKKEAADLE